jgi:protein SCO1/2
MSTVAPKLLHPQARLGGVGGLLTKWWVWLGLVTFFFAFPIWKSLNRVLPPELPIIAQLPTWRLTSENGTPFGTAELQGRVYLANFIFTRCPTVCPKMLQDTALIQKRIRGTGHKVALATFTVDPDHDTPAVLFKTARGLKANPYTWTFLTSTDKPALLKLYQEGFKVNAAAGAGLMDIAHSEKIVLVDQLGRVRGYYSYDKNSVNQLMIDVGLLINRPVTKEPSHGA